MFFILMQFFAISFVQSNGLEMYHSKVKLIKSGDSKIMSFIKGEDKALRNLSSSDCDKVNGEYTGSFYGLEDGSTYNKTILKFDCSKEGISYVEIYNTLYEMKFSLSSSSVKISSDTKDILIADSKLNLRIEILDWKNLFRFYGKDSNGNSFIMLNIKSKKGNWPMPKRQALE